MGKKYDARKMTELCDTIEYVVEKYASHAEMLENEYEIYNSNNTYRGEAADASKEFVYKGQGRLTKEQVRVLTRLSRKFNETQNSFSSMVDSSPNAKIDTDVIEYDRRYFERHKESFEERAYRLERITREMADKFERFGYITSISCDRARYGFEDMCGYSGFMNKCLRKFEEFDEGITLHLKSSGIDSYMYDLEKDTKATINALDGMTVYKPDVEKITVTPIAQMASKMMYSAGLIPIQQSGQSQTVLTVPNWIKDILSDSEIRQYFKYTDDGFFICTLPMDKLFAKAGLTDAMQTTVESWYLIGVYDPEKKPPEVTYGAAIINQKGNQGSIIPFTAINMDLMEETITAYQKGESLDMDSLYTSIAPILLADDEEQYYKHPNEKMMKYFCDAGNDGSILVADLVVQDNLKRFSSSSSLTDTTVVVEFAYKYDEYCSQSRNTIDSLIDKKICTKDPVTGTITMTIQDSDNLSMDEYNALLMMTTDDPDIYAYIAENNAHAKALSFNFQPKESIQSDCWPGENANADGDGNQSSSGSEHSYKDKDGRYYKKAVKEHKDQFTN
ncbi:T7SS effector LXG polymorphic toxin [Ruminococcus sp.]|uniref:T7SS effector LXG polymorphic toxin n=1 Tax=Ruminococcus sp. TaxID=41978 RepID=UPI0025D86F59|nr:T7SS effector LXG polymorphic toxin [Ruminococcus sp.]